MKRHEQAEAVLNRFFAECGDAVPSQGEIDPVLDRVWERLQERAEWLDARMPAAPSRSFHFAWAAAFMMVAALVMVSVLVWRQGPPFSATVKNRKTDEHSMSRSSSQQTRESLQLTVPQDVFEVASVKLLPPSSDLVQNANRGAAAITALTGCSGYMSTPKLDPGRLTISAITVYSLVMTAYDQDCTLVEGGPAWTRLGGSYYELQALLPEGTPSYTSQELLKGKAPRLQKMLQNLLADRFRLVVKHEFREMSVYALTVATRGKMRLSPDETRPLPASFPSFPGIPQPTVGRGQFRQTLAISGEVQLSGHALSTSDLAKALRTNAGRLIVDQTGLAEIFDVDLKFAREEALPLPTPPGQIPAVTPPPQSIPPLPGPQLPGQPLPGAQQPATPLPGPTLSTALEEQLGLKLQSVKMPIEVLVIESVERPSEN